jgi:hypothetical protein
MLKHSTIGVGWDIGGWNCDNNSKSRDALVIVGALGELLGQPWRGNLRHVINEAVSTADFLAKIFGLCRLASGFSNSSVTVAIDAPLCFPESLIALLTAGRTERSLGDSAANPYLYRFTERRLATVPLSTVKDMIGSQSTKAIHATAPTIQSLGVWSDGGTTRFIETYPAACRRRAAGTEELGLIGLSGHNDIIDAGVCALIAHRFATSPQTLEPPPAEAPATERLDMAADRQDGAGDSSISLHGIFKIFVTDFLDHTRQRQFDFLNRNDGPKQIVTIGRASYLDLGAKDTLDVTGSPRTNEQRTGGQSFLTIERNALLRHSHIFVYPIMMTFKMTVVLP